MNWIWIGLLVFSILCAGFTGQMQALTLASFESAQEAVWLALKLVGIMAFWLGVMRVAQDSGLMGSIARLLRRPMRWLFPDVPPEHPAMSAMIMNFGANMIGLANAATPFGIKAMVELDKLNRHRGTATNAMCLFLAINTSSLSLFPTGTMGLRAAAGSKDPASIWLPTLLATACSTLTAIAVVKLLQRLRRYQLPAEGVQAEVQAAAAAPETPVVPLAAPAVAGPAARIFVWLSLAGFLAALLYHHLGLVWRVERVATAAEALRSLAPWLDPLLGRLIDPPALGVGTLVKNAFSFWAIPALMGGLLLYGVARGVRVYESVVEGAKEGFQVAVRIIPYLVAILVVVAMFKASGAMDLLKATVGRLTELVGMPAEAVPMAIIRPLSGNGAFAYMSSIFTQYGPDSYLGQMVSVIQGSMETTLYVLAVYFGAVGVFRVRHALAAGLLADLAGVIAAVVLTSLFFG
ncbi:MAG TPA: nucleoside recognition domain-containing protein [Myxococcota bacterium]|nr:nucleoside recognition domain-containing protein [Myxococcota bacterium]HRY92070.1 nucleoside recognition domain-containing protein [Myxococcota bacterium]HSA22327.1 nucleoside recognition domain-containing protein [Myxococcota bacterium]